MMKNTLLLVHLVLVGLWLGCVLTEVLFERALLGAVVLLGIVAALGTGIHLAASV